MSENKRTKVEIVAPVHNRKEITLLCLRSIARLNNENLDIHSVIVDDGSTDGTSEAIKKEFPNVEIVQGDGNLWFTEGTNVGVRAALKHEPDYVLMINDDQVFDSDSLIYMVETAEKHPRSIIGPLLLLWDTPHKLFQVSPKWETLKGGWQFFEEQTVWTIPQKPWEVGIIVGNCVLVPVDAMREEGLMNSKRYPNFGDAEYTPRLRKKGWKLLIEPRARVFFQPNTLPPKISKMPLKNKMDALFFNLGHTHNLRRRYYMHVDGAPTKLQGFISYWMFFASVIFQKFGKKTTEKSEREIAEVFVNAVVKD